MPTKLSVFRVLRDLEILCGVYECPQFNVKNFHYYDRSDINSLTKKNFSLIKLTGYRYNFIPRFLGYSFSLLKLNLNRHNKKKLKIDLARTAENFNVRENIPLFSDDLSEFSLDYCNLLDKFRYLLIDLSYHYVIILSKRSI